MRFKLFEIFNAIPVEQITNATFLQKFLVMLAVSVLGYILGSLCFAIIFTRLFTGKDIRKLGSGTAGTANVLRNVGVLPGILTGVFDFLKGVVAVYCGFFLFKMVGFESYAGGCFATVFVLLGHFYPVFFGYRGGKGVVTMGGIISVLHVKLFLFLVLIYFTVLLISKMTSLAALITFFILPIANLVICLLEHQKYLFSTILYICVTFLIFFTHRENIKRLKAGTEPKLVVK
ncbi:MAG: glycerol-3-phosphate 1-O-acyltransferase PlsY, partial [Oscillospiraceae bacterium]|nr:glycerol-3-phosphate 1-O-acyltransferase PlsY [Oscillospiraceae bacterium]